MSKMINKPLTWALVDIITGNVLETFRTNYCALEWKRKIWREYGIKTKIVRYTEQDDIKQ